MGDESNQQLARRVAALAVLRTLLFLAALALISTVLVYRGETSLLSPTRRLAYGVGGAVLLSAALHAYFLRRGRGLLRLSMLELVFDQVLWTIVAYMSGGAASGATSLYGITCLQGGLLLGVGGVVAGAVAAGVFFSVLVVTLESGVLELPLDQPGRWAVLSEGQSTFYVVLNFFVLLLVTLLVSYLAERLARTGGELADARARAEKAERMAALGRLSAGLAHEIRNPLSAISTSVQLLRSAVAHPEDRELCEIVLREAGRLEELVSDMVDLAKPRPPNKVDTEVVRLIRDIMELASRSGRAQSDISLRFILEGSEPVMIQADAAQLRQLIWNLVRNAIQASLPGGEVRVRLQSRGVPVLSVEDDGTGISLENRGQLFDAFFTTRSQGTGIGLAVVKRIADEHGFGLEVESEAGRGASFRIRLGRRPSLLPPPSP